MRPPTSGGLFLMLRIAVGSKYLREYGGQHVEGRELELETTYRVSFLGLIIEDRQYQYF